MSLIMEEKLFKLKGKTLVIIDWANVYGWFEHLKWKINPEKLYRYLRSYEEVETINFYFGVELQIGVRGKEYNELLKRQWNRPYLCAVEKLEPFLWV